MMTFEEFESWIEVNGLTDGSYEDSLDFLALIGVAWFEEARKKRPDLTLDMVCNSMFEGVPFSHS